MRRRRRIATEPVRPQFPVVVFYVVSVLLLMLHQMWFPFGPHEWQIPIRLPQEAHSTGLQPLRFADVPLKHEVFVARGPGGAIGTIRIYVEGTLAAEPIEGFDRYRAELRRLKWSLTNRPLGNPILYIETGVRYGEAVRLMSIARSEGFEDVEWFPSDPAR